MDNAVGKEKYWVYLQGDFLDYFTWRDVGKVCCLNMNTMCSHLERQVEQCHQ